MFQALFEAREDSTVKMCDLPLNIDGLTEVFFIKLKLSHEGKVLADNFYWEGLEEGNWKAVQTISATLETCFRQAGTGEVEILIDSRSGQQILPAFYSDNYFSLLGGESKTVKVEYLTEQDYIPSITVEQLR